MSHVLKGLKPLNIEHPMVMRKKTNKKTRLAQRVLKGVLLLIGIDSIPNLLQKFNGGIHDVKISNQF